jgi:hypothetical protein
MLTAVGCKLHVFAPEPLDRDGHVSLQRLS